MLARLRLDISDGRVVVATNACDLRAACEAYLSEVRTEKSTLRTDRSVCLLSETRLAGGDHFGNEVRVCDEVISVIRTLAPPEAAVDALGYPLSSVASTGTDPPPLPPNSGRGRRLVYERAGQRVWAVDDEESTVRSWLVSGSRYDNEVPGTHAAYSRSEMSTAWNGKAWLPMMVRWHTAPGRLPATSEPRRRLTWDFVQIGTKVVVVDPEWFCADGER